MTLKLTIVLFSSLLVIASCSTSTTQTPNNGSQTAVVTSAPLSTSTTPVAQPSVPPAIQTFTSSISLLVAQKGEGAAARGPKEFWRDAFHEKKATEWDKDRNKKKGEGEDERETPPQKIPGIGDELTGRAVALAELSTC
jgi:hypothetical protein